MGHKAEESFNKMTTVYFHKGSILFAWLPGKLELVSIGNEVESEGKFE